MIYYDRDGEHGQCTVVTARSGRLEGRRVVGGQEAEGRRHYEEAASVSRSTPGRENEAMKRREWEEDLDEASVEREAAAGIGQRVPLPDVDEASGSPS